MEPYNSEKEVRSTATDEIDIASVFREFGRLLVGLGGSLVNVVIWLRRKTIQYAIVIIAILVLCIGYKVGLSRMVQSEKYSSTLILRSKHLNGPLLEKYIEKLNQGAETRAKLLNIDTSLAAKMIYFEVEPFITEEEIIEFELFRQDLLTKVSEEDATEVIDQLQLQNRSTYQLTVTLTSKDDNLLEEIQRPILDYISENDFVKKRLEIERRDLEARQAKIHEEITNLDSLKSILIRNLAIQGITRDKGSNNVFLSENQNLNPISVFREFLNYYSQEQIIGRELYLRPNFEVIDGFGLITPAETNSLLEDLYESISLGLILSFSIIFFVEINKALNRREKELGNR